MNKKLLSAMCGLLACATAAFAHPNSTSMTNNSSLAAKVQDGEDCENDPLVQQADFSKVVPLPASISAGKGLFSMTAATAITYTPGADMQRNAEFLAQYVKDVTGMTLPVGTKGKTTIALRLEPKAKGFASPDAYRIAVTKKGITVTATTAAGVFYGIQTLRKALPGIRHCANCKKVAPEVQWPLATVTDGPRFGYRGMMLDCSRHFWSVAEVKRVLDILALHNLNRFHWHLTDDQGWRFEVPGYPKLTTVGSKRAATVLGRNSELTDRTPYGPYFYTDAEIRDIVKYAADRYITIVPEVDMPGHMTAALAAYPELGCTGGPYKVGQYWGVYNDILCVGNPKTLEFVKAVIDKLCDLFPTSTYINIGGDEAPKVRWEKCPKDQALISQQGIVAKEGRSKEDLLQGYLARRVEAYLATKGRKVMGWDELLGCGVDTTATILSWRGAAPGAKGAQQGHDVVMSPTSNCYFDFDQSEDHAIEPTNCYGTLPIEKVYNWNPVADGLSEAAQRHIIGVQANVWCEYITMDHVLEYMILPRLAALSEVQWMQQDKRSWEGFVARETKLRNLYGIYGWTYAHHMWPDEFRKVAKQY